MKCKYPPWALARMEFKSFEENNTGNGSSSDNNGKNQQQQINNVT